MIWNDYELLNMIKFHFYARHSLFLLEPQGTNKNADISSIELNTLAWTSHDKKKKV